MKDLKCSFLFLLSGSLLNICCPPILAALTDYQALGNLILENVLVLFAEEVKSNCIALVSVEGVSMLCHNLSEEQEITCET